MKHYFRFLRKIGITLLEISLKIFDLFHMPMFIHIKGTVNHRSASRLIIAFRLRLRKWNFHGANT